MKKVLLSLMAAGMALTAFSQSYYLIPGPDGSNPGNLNSDAEYPPGGGLPAGWTTLMTGNGSDVWSATTALPFAFKFNGVAETQFKVSNTGVLTFSTGATAVPSENNENLPSANIPDKSILCWGLNVKATSDYIVTKTFGTAPNRQFWIQFNSAAEKNIQSGWLYMSIVLEETSNNIYIVDQRFFCTDGTNPCTNKTALSLGVQVNGTTAVKVAGTPAYQAVSGNNVTDPSDNKYYSFFYGVQPALDLKMLSTSVGDLVTKNANTSIQGSFVNMGSSAINKFDLYYSVDGGTAEKASITGVNIATGGVYNFTHSKPYVAATGGVSGKLVIWTANPNGSADEKVDNDTVKKSFFVVNGTGAPKKVFFEEATGAWCIHCPDAHTYMEKLKEDFGSDVVIGVHHNADAMTNTESDAINAAFASGYPNGYVDRTLFTGYTKVGTNRTDWSNLVTKQKALYTPVKVNISNVSFDDATRKIQFDIEAEFTDYYSGDIRIGAMIKEDYMRGAGSSPLWDQAIASTYINNPNHLYYQKKTPMVGYYHKNVIINVPSTAWGSAGSIPGTAAPGDKFKKTYTYTLPALTNANIPTTAEFSPVGSVFSRNKPQEIWLIGFVAKNNTSVGKREVLNVNERQLWDLSAGNMLVKAGTTVVEAYPNPASANTLVQFTVPAVQKVTVRVSNALGQVVVEKTIDNANAGQQAVELNTANLANGFYNVSIVGGSVSGATKLMIAH